MNKHAFGSVPEAWREEPAVPMPDHKGSLPTVGSAVPIAENVIRYFRDHDDLDLVMTPRGIGALAGLLLTSTWTTVVDLQFELENRGMIIPMASLYPLLERLVKIGFVSRREEAGAKGRPKAFFCITHIGRSAVSLGDTIAKSHETSGGVING